ncbi:MAG: hypothetical protein QG602_3663 [Verrucomicrobiota bacterium]|nr:hypothetical protein [Verrucomicrobiota bacterium]
MKTPTIIVRLGGLYLLATSGVGLVQLNKARQMAAQFGMNQNQITGDIQLYLWLGLFVGLAATAFAGPLARILTFDAEPREPSVDLSARLLGGK